VFGGRGINAVRSQKCERAIVEPDCGIGLLGGIEKLVFVATFGVVWSKDATIDKPVRDKQLEKASNFRKYNLPKSTFVHIPCSEDLVGSGIGNLERNSSTMFNTVNSHLNAIVKWSDRMSQVSSEAESFTLDDWLSSLRVVTKVLQSVCSYTFVVVLCGAVPAGKDLAVAEQFEKILRVRWVRIFNRIVEPNLRAGVKWNVVGGN
jgi:hypothetical protein